MNILLIPTNFVWTALKVLLTVTKFNKKLGWIRATVTVLNVSLALGRDIKQFKTIGILFNLFGNMKSVSYHRFVALLFCVQKVQLCLICYVFTVLSLYSVLEMEVLQVSAPITGDYHYL